MRELQTFIFTVTKLPRYVAITIIIIGCPVNPINDYGHGLEFLDKLVQERNAKRLITDHYLKLQSDFSIGSLSFVLINRRNQYIDNNISPTTV